MFKKSSKGTNPTLFGGLAQQFTGAKLRSFNDPAAWHNIFRDHVTGKIDESIFSVLFFDGNGRPNAPIRILVAMMILKEGHGWSDKQLYEQCQFNALIMNSLGLTNISDEPPVPSTYYAFRSRLFDYSTEEGIDLLGLCFEALSSSQGKFFKSDGTKLRMDSKLIGSNIAKCSRLQLVIRCINEFRKKMSKPALAKLLPGDVEFFAKLAKLSAGQMVYPLSGEEKSAMLLYCGELIERLLQQDQDDGGENKVRGMLERVFEEQFSVEAEVVVLRDPKEIGSDSLQSPFDPDAEYRRKDTQQVRGYSVNVTETCSGDAGKLDLITSVQVEGASFPDNAFLQEAVERSGRVAGQAREVSADGAYHSLPNDEYAIKNEMEIHYTGFQGAAGRFAFAYALSKLLATDTRTGEEYAMTQYKTDKYRIKVPEQGQFKSYYFDQQAVDNYFKRRKVIEMPAEIRNRRANVEATIFQMAFHTRNNKTRYRGKQKTQMWATSRAAWVNLRRIVVFLGVPRTNGAKNALAGPISLLRLVFSSARALRIRNVSNIAGQLPRLFSFIIGDNPKALLQ